MKWRIAGKRQRAILRERMERDYGYAVYHEGDPVVFAGEEVYEVALKRE